MIEAFALCFLGVAIYLGLNDVADALRRDKVINVKLQEIYLKTSGRDD